MPKTVSLHSSPYVDGDMSAQGTSNARHVATLAGLKASRANYATSSQNHKTTSDHIPAAFT
jgi:hypothetical protein